MRVLFLTRYGRLGASSRLRSLQYMPLFENMGIKCTALPLFDDNQLAKRYQKDRFGIFSVVKSYFNRLLILLKKNNFNLIWIEKEALPWMPTWFERGLLAGLPYVLDYDDAIFHIYDMHSSALVRRCLGKRIDKLMAGSTLVVTGNAYLAQRAKKAGAKLVEIVPTVIDLERYIEKSASIDKAIPLRIVWIGSPSTTRYLDLLREPLAVLSRQFPFQLRVIGGDTITMPGVDIEILPWEEASEVDLIRACDIGVMPLIDTPWERGKCGYKLIQYMACGLPVVASPVGVNTDIVSADENGYLADSDEEWVDALGKLLEDAVLRQRMGKAGRKRVEALYCIQKAGPQLASMLLAAGEYH